MCFHDPQDINYNRFWARLVLRLDNELWANFVNHSGLFDAQGRFAGLTSFKPGTETEASEGGMAMTPVVVPVVTLHRFLEAGTKALVPAAK